MKLRPYFEAALGNAIDDLWPADAKRPIRDMGRYHSVLYWMTGHTEGEVLRLFGRPVPKGLDMPNPVSAAAFLLESHHHLDQRSLQDAMRPRQEAEEDADVDVLALHPEASLVLVRLKTRRAFDNEGLQMEHCLRSFLHYYDEHERGEIAILSVRQEETPHTGVRPVATIEVDLREHPRAHRIVQLQGPQNGALPPHVSRSRVADLLDAVHLSPHLSGRWADRLRDNPKNRIEAEVRVADAILDHAFSGALHNGNPPPTATHVLNVAAPYLKMLHEPKVVDGDALAIWQTPRVHLEVHVAPTPPFTTFKLRVDGTPFTAHTFTELEALRNPQKDTPTSHAPATLTQDGARFKDRIDRLPRA